MEAMSNKTEVEAQLLYEATIYNNCVTIDIAKC